MGRAKALQSLENQHLKSARRNLVLRFRIAGYHSLSMYRLSPDVASVNIESSSRQGWRRRLRRRAKLARTLALHWSHYAPKIRSLAGAAPPAVRSRPPHRSAARLPGHVAERGRPSRSVLL